MILLLLLFIFIYIYYLLILYIIPWSLCPDQCCTYVYAYMLMLVVIAIFSGFLHQFTAGVVLGCGLVHLTYMVILCYFPFFGERTLKKKKNLFHAYCLIATVTLSLISPVVALARFSYVPTHFPPLLCLSNNQNWMFYSLGLPGVIILAIEVTLCILLIRAIHKVRVDCVSICTVYTHIIAMHGQIL